MRRSTQAGSRAAAPRASSRVRATRCWRRRIVLLRPMPSSRRCAASVSSWAAPIPRTPRRACSRPARTPASTAPWRWSRPAAIRTWPHCGEACAQRAHTKLTLDAPDLSAFFGRHDLQIGGGGGATWERCCLGAPSIAVMVADNQRSVVPALADLGVLEAASLDAPDGDPQSLAVVLRALLPDAQRRQRLAEAGRALVDGRGAQRVALCLLADTAVVRAGTMQDARLLHAWRNHPRVRQASHDPAEIPLAAHLRWLESVLRDPARLLLLAEVGGIPVGSVRFDAGSDGQYEVSLYLDPALQGLGLGLGRAVLRAGEAALTARHEGAVTVHARCARTTPPHAGCSKRPATKAGRFPSTAACRCEAACRMALHEDSRASDRCGPPALPDRGTVRQPQPAARPRPGDRGCRCRQRRRCAQAADLYGRHDDAGRGHAGLRDRRSEKPVGRPAPP